MIIRIYYEKILHTHSLNIIIVIFLKNCLYLNNLDIKHSIVNMFV